MRITSPVSWLSGNLRRGRGALALDLVDSRIISTSIETEIALRWAYMYQYSDKRLQIMRTDIFCEIFEDKISVHGLQAP